MGTALDVILSGGASTQEAGDPPVQQEAQTQTAAAPSGNAPHTGEQQTQTGAAEVASTGAAADGASPAQESGTMVPLKALEEERKGRQDWKEKAIRFEEQLNSMRAQQPQPQGQQQHQQAQPQSLTYEQALLNERMNMSEMMVRNQHQDVDDMLGVFQKAVAENPALGVQLGQQRHPWQWMYDQAKRMKAMEEIGSDPVAYRERLKAELEAEFKAAQGTSPDHQADASATTQVATKPVIPQSLATARSAAPRAAPTWTGPTSLNDILKR